MTPTDTNRCLTHTFTHSHTREEEEAWASLAMMRTGSCHRLSIPCMSPMARNKLVTALPATLSGYLRCTGLCQAPLLSYCCAFACVCVCVHPRKRRAPPWLHSPSPFEPSRDSSATLYLAGLGCHEGPLPQHEGFKGVHCCTSFLIESQTHRRRHNRHSSMQSESVMAAFLTVGRRVCVCVCVCVCKVVANC